MIRFHTRFFLAAVATLAIALPFTVPAASDNVSVLACEGAFAKETSHAKLVETFGKVNVAILDIDSDQGVKVKASVIYPDEPRRRIDVVWHDDKARRRPATIRVGFKSGWRTARGLHIGSELAEIEKVNGKPFKLTGFDWDLGGRVSNWQGGALAKLPGGCELRFGFDPWADAPDDARDKVSGEKEFLSNDPNMRATKPTVSEIILSYPE